jgi:hypothetical protein
MLFRDGLVARVDRRKSEALEDHLLRKVSLSTTSSIRPVSSRSQYCLIEKDSGVREYFQCLRTPETSKKTFKLPNMPE